MEKEEFRDNILSVNQWLRVLLMIGFLVLSWLLRFGQLAIVLIQALFALIAGRANDNMRQAGTVLALYQAQIWLYVSYATQARPYPFSDLPKTAADLDMMALGDSEPEAFGEDDDVFSDISFKASGQSGEGGGAGGKGSSGEADDTDKGGRKSD